MEEVVLPLNGGGQVQQGEEGDEDDEDDEDDGEVGHVLFEVNHTPVAQLPPELQLGDADPEADDGAGPNIVEQLAEHGVSVSPLFAVDFGCAVWLEYKSFDSEELRVRYVSFPPVDVDRSAEGYSGLSSPGAVHTLEVPPEVDLKRVCHIGLDQAQGTVILGMRSSTVYVLRYS